MSYVLPRLPYSYDALEPYIDQETMKIHHTKHHQNYINNANIILKALPKEYSKLSVDELIMQLEDILIDKRMSLRNNAGGHANHSMFWKGLKTGTVCQGQLQGAIEREFNSLEKFKQLFETVAVNHFGSGWIWLIKTGKKLNIVSTANQDNPLMGEKMIGIFGYPIIGLDLWEHAYYLKYQNRRLDYIKAFWNVINWDEANLRYSYKKDAI
ncbi:MAG: Fe-Mn family superoxide dismutase [Candidatus Dasytiphilus stammeri]